MKATFARLRAGLELTATILAIVVCGLVVARHFGFSNTAPAPVRAKRPEPPLSSAPVSIVGASLEGSPSAGVTLVEFSDFSCPYCGAFARDVLPKIEERYVKTGKVRLAFKNMPLERIHATARIAAEGAECAARQGKFWDMHNWLFDNPKSVAAESLKAQALRLQLDVAQFSACLGGEAKDQIDADADEARALGVSGTPTFFIGSMTKPGLVSVTERLTGGQSESSLSKAIDAALTQRAGTR